jgi:hypothetical protein
MNDVDRKDIRWLIGPAAERWLAEAAADARSISAVASRLRRSLSATQVHLVLEQVELRRRARCRFTHASRMFFTRKGLEQATDELIASYKAARFPPASTLADLGCGIGGDLMAMCRRGSVVAVDQNPVCALLAPANVRAVIGGGTAEVCEQDVRSMALTRFAAWHVDPDRRARAGRTIGLVQTDPDGAAIDAMLRQNENAAVKLAPAARIPRHWCGAELEWIGHRRECQQLVVWFGSLALQPGIRLATILRGDALPRTIRGQADRPIEPANRVLSYLMEPHPCVLAARLTGELAVAHELHALAHDVAYLTGDRPIADAALGCFEVLDQMAFDRRRVRAALKTRRMGRLEVKKRATRPDPAAVARALSVPGDTSGTLFLFPFRGRVWAVIARRV